MGVKLSPNSPSIAEGRRWRDGGSLGVKCRAMATKEKELEDRLREVGSRLAYPPSAVDELLLPLLDVSSCLAQHPAVIVKVDRPRKAGSSNLDECPRSSSKSNEKVPSISKFYSFKSSNKLKADVKSDDDISKADKFSSTTGSETEDNSLKSSRNSMVSSPTSAVSKDNGVVGSKVRNDASKSKLSEDSPLTGQKLKGTITPKAGDEFNKEH
ncbi:hypothetical protein B296_00008771 [Ensete ventricosum]|uniref:Uncharacterized protein n=1 Tax=Ensete ventricosum TaxID=4639 RepID=A0A427AI40_ENSVE|nr:hypothetical protein B296_00008771 [Ensete ventricosum]